MAPRNTIDLELLKTAMLFRPHETAVLAPAVMDWLR